MASARRAATMAVHPSVLLMSALQWSGRRYRWCVSGLSCSHSSAGVGDDHDEGRGDDAADAISSYPMITPR
ncbi:hypothetical protein E4P41_20345 [Geodermatophilus sp. DF01-2]|nr:hypothetical protein E4P41_20345 [Geodermatophilus sp. DF01_2]